MPREVAPWTSGLERTLSKSLPLPFVLPRIGQARMAGCCRFSRKRMIDCRGKAFVQVQHAARKTELLQAFQQEFQGFPGQYEAHRQGSGAPVVARSHRPWCGNPHKVSCAFPGLAAHCHLPALLSFSQKGSSRKSMAISMPTRTIVCEMQLARAALICVSLSRNVFTSIAWFRYSPIVLLSATSSRSAQAASMLEHSVLAWSKTSRIISSASRSHTDAHLPLSVRIAESWTGAPSVWFGVVT